MKAGTAVTKALTSVSLPRYAIDAIQMNLHPQERTMAFHRFYDAPIWQGPLTEDFAHMSDERVAFRASFILSEVMEMFEKGLGIRIDHIHFQAVHKNRGMDVVPLDERNIADADLCQAILALMPVARRNLIEYVDALGDLNVVVNGNAIELGVDMRAVDQEICASNFTKPGRDGQPIIGDGQTGPVGKVMKGPDFMEPQLAVVLGLENEDA